MSIQLEFEKWALAYSGCDGGDIGNPKKNQYGYVVLNGEEDMILRVCLRICDKILLNHPKDTTTGKLMYNTFLTGK